MIEARLISTWDGLVGSLALIALITLALCVMVRFVKLADVPRHLGVIAVIAILLTTLPRIIASLWNSLGFAQQLGIITLGVAIALLFSASRRRSNNARKK